MGMVNGGQFVIGGYDWKRVSLTREGEGGGNFPDLESALQDLEKKVADGYTPTVADPYEINLGPGVHNYTRSTAFNLPVGTIIRGSGPSATTIQGTISVTDNAENMVNFGGWAVTVTAHPFSNGDRVKVTGIVNASPRNGDGTDWESLNGKVYTVSIFGANAIFPQDVLGNNIDVSSFTATYGSGGLIERLDPIFTCSEAIISDLTFTKCGTAVQRTGGSALSRLENVFCTGIDTLYDGHTSGIQILQNCNSTSGTNSQVICDGGVIFAVLNCFFNLPNLDGTVPLVKHNAGRFAMRDTIFDGTGVGVVTPNSWALEIDFAEGGFGLNQCELASNDYFNMEKAIEIADNTGEIFSNSETINNCTTDLVIQGAGGTYSGLYSFTALNADPNKFTLNGNPPPLNFVNSTDGTLTAASQLVTLTTNTTLSQIHTNVLCDNVNDFTVTLPDAAQYTNWVYTIKNISTNLVTIATTGAATIDNEVTEIVGQYEAIKVVSDGTNWWVI